MIIESSWRSPALILAATLFSAVVSEAATFSIVSKGKPRAEVVVPAEEPGSPVTFAAQELQRYVREMSGAELPIVRTASKKTAITLATRQFSTNKQTVNDPRERDRYRISIDARKLQIEGASPRAVLFAVYDLLERLGCGWCVPGDDSVPRRNTLELASLELDTRPAFQYRMMLDFPLLTVAQSIAISDWLAKNRMNWVHECPNAHGEPKAWYDRRDRVVPELKKRGLNVLVGGHTMHTWVPETNLASHPEWFAVNAGGPKPTLCISNPDMTAELIKNMRHFLDRCPEVDVVDLWHADGEAFCHCPKCTRGVLADNVNTNSPIPGDAIRSAYAITYVELLNRVADAIARNHPKVLLGPLIYSQTDRAMPDQAPHLADNILVGVAHFFRDSYRPLIGEPKSAINLRFLGNDLTWIAKSKHSYIYEYYNGWIAPYIYPGAQIIVRDLETLRDLQVQGVSSDMYGYSPVNMYVAARALWSPTIDWKDTIRDYCTRYFGDVAGEMAENEIRLETGIFGLAGYQCSGARGASKAAEVLTAARFLYQERPSQITFLKAVINKTKDPQVKARLERALKPWSLWSEEPRFWAFPDFKD